jgi:hypothetical protein
LGVWGLSWILPIRNHRLVVIDTALEDRESVNAMEVTDMTWETTLEEGKIEEAVVRIKEQPTLGKRGLCATLLQKLFVRRSKSITVEAVIQFAPEE